MSCSNSRRTDSRQADDAVGRFRGLRSRWPALALFLIPAAALVACGGREQALEATLHEESAVKPSLFSVPTNQMGQIRLSEVQDQTWATTIRTTGTVDWDVDHTTQAITQVSGPITRILVDTGSMVKEDDPLLYVSSPDVTNAIAAYRKARNRLDYELRQLERSKDLLAHRAIAEKDLEAVQADYNDASTELQNDLQALRIFGVSQQEIDQAERQGVPINPQLAVRSPIAGMVVQKLVFPGQLIQAGATTCFAISDISTVWVQGHIYEKDLTEVRIGDPVEATNSAIPEVFHGIISYIGAMVDPATRTTPVRIVTRNPGGILKKDLIVDTVIHTRSPRKVLAIPTSAVLYNANNLPFVYVQRELGKFAERSITTGRQQDDATEVLNGLNRGESVVSEGSVFLQFANSYQR